MFFTLSISLLTSRLVLEALGVENYGIYNVVGGVVIMLNAFTASLTVATQRYLTYEVGRKDLFRYNLVFNHCSYIFGGLSLLLIILCESVGIWFLHSKMHIPHDSMRAASIVFQMSLVSTIMSIQIIPYLATVIAYEKMSIYAIITIIEAVLKLLVAGLLFVTNSHRLVLYAFGMALISIINFSIYFIYCHQKHTECKIRRIWDYTLFKELVSFSGWNIFASLASMMKEQGLNILLNVFFTPVVNTARAIAIQINNVLNQFYNSFNTAFQPQITKYYACSDFSNMNKLVMRGSKFGYFLILLVALPIMFETSFIIKLWLGQVPEYTVIFTRLIIVITALDCLSSPLMTAAQATGRIKVYQLTIGSLLMANLPISYVILKMGYPPYSVFIVACIIAAVCVFVRIFILAHMYDFPAWEYIKYVIFRIMPTTGISALGIFIGVKFVNLDDLLKLCMVIILTLCITPAAIWWVGLDKSERGSLKNYFYSKITRKIST